jgi:protein-tyrosine phosphatase
MAEFLMKDLVKGRGLEDQFYIASAATSTEELGSDVHSGTKKKLVEKGIAFEKRRAVQVTQKDYDTYDDIEKGCIGLLEAYIGRDWQQRSSRILLWS